MSEMSMNEMGMNELEQVTGGRKTVEATRDEANIRKGPGTSYAIIGKTVHGKTAAYLGEKVTRHGRTWLKVRHNGQVGWICSDYVKFH